MSALSAPLAFAILALASLPNGHPIASFRNHHLGPEGRAGKLAEQIAEAALTFHLDEYLIAAVAWTESRFDSYAVGLLGELSLMQLHPRTLAGRSYRRYHGLSQDDRDRLAIHLGADALRHGFIACGRSVPKAVGFYKSGRCISGPAVHGVLVARWRMMRFAGLKS